MVCNRSCNLLVVRRKNAVSAAKRAPGQQSLTTEMCIFKIECARTRFIAFYCFFLLVPFVSRYCVSVSIATVINTEENIAHVQFAVWRFGFSRSCVCVCVHAPSEPSTAKHCTRNGNCLIYSSQRWCVGHTTLQRQWIICIASRIMVLAVCVVCVCVCVRMCTAEQCTCTVCAQDISNDTMELLWDELRTPRSHYLTFFDFNFTNLRSKNARSLWTSAAIDFAYVRDCNWPRYWLFFISFIAP